MDGGKLARYAQLGANDRECCFHKKCTYLLTAAINLWTFALFCFVVCWRSAWQGLKIACALPPVSSGSKIQPQCGSLRKMQSENKSWF